MNYPETVSLRRGWISAICLLALMSPALAAGGATFSDATRSSGIKYKNVCGAVGDKKGWLNEQIGAGAGWLDYDGDGHLDLYIVNGSTFERGAGEGEPNQLYRGDGKGNFTDVTAKAGVGDRGWGYGVTIGDYDNDGHPDIYLTNFGPNVLYRNRGDGTFEDVTEKAGVGDSQYSASAAFFDMDRDGDLDLYVGNYMFTDPDKVPRRGSPEARKANCQYQGIQVTCGPLGQTPLHDVLYRNNDDGTFTDVTAAAGVELKTPRFALGVVSGDYDNDGDADLYVANDSVQNSLWTNRGDGTFIDAGVMTLSALNSDGRAQAGMGTDFGDYNGDGWLDLVVTNFSQDYNTVYRNMAGKFFIDESSLVGMNVTQLALSWGTGLYDFDLDGDLDLFIANGHIYPEIDDYSTGSRYHQANHLFLNEGGKFVESHAKSGPGMAIKRSFRGAAFADYDEDGDMDVFVTSLDDAGLLLRNDTKTTNHWLVVRLVGQASNRDAVGARVTLNAAGHVQLRERKGGGSFLSASDSGLHFGLGAATKIELLEVRWPSGKRTTLRDVKVDQALTIEE